VSEARDLRRQLAELTQIGVPACCADAQSSSARNNWGGVIKQHSTRIRGSRQQDALNFRKVHRLHQMMVEAGFP
jgi:hypothetical protein